MLSTRLSAAKLGSQGGWTRDGDGSSPTGSTGPSDNNTAAYIHTETTGSASLAATEANGALSLDGAAADPFIAGANRSITLRHCIQGNFNGGMSGEEGLRIQGRASSADPWTTIATLPGWHYLSTRNAGDSLADYASVTFTVAEDGGWRDTTVNIPDACSALRLAPRYHSGVTYAHDIALHTLTLTYSPA